MEFYNQIATSSAHRKSRDDNKNFIFLHSEYLNELTEIAFNTKDKNHHKACWILELICEERMELFIPFIDGFCGNLKNYKSDSAIRSISKIGLFLVKNKNIHLSENQEEKIIETFLDWLIDSDKAANAAYSMRTLFILGKKYNWINDELKALLSRDCSHQTAGYKFAVKDILKQLK
ncbi:hypothetical protein OX283_007575 [Flavobacterium sp. SUN052]|uniref:hypothetical protein n=1 Tax=Flavobacterium sp. SUN052 TaxID=3002441 RepID=UPI00237ECE3C|nr:hypothetical protein [Flavobacterium sp. SUN052]MEC4004512.1 hypothetical protein [Flavobacterium sp. SUN052]